MRSCFKYSCRQNCISYNPSSGREEGFFSAEYEEMIEIEGEQRMCSLLVCGAVKV